MKSTEKFDQVFDLLNITNIELSKISGVDPSLVSRYRNGKRLPNASSVHFTKLCDGLATYAVDNGMWPKMQSLIKITEDEDPSESVLYYFLNSPSKQNSSEQYPLISVSESRIFGDKLTMLMDILEVSNAVLAKALCVDPSLISRMKNGKRIPKKNTELVENICIYFHKKILSKCLMSEVGNILNISPDDCIGGGQDFIQRFSDWLLNVQTNTNTDPYSYFTNTLKLPDLPKADPDFDLINNINITSPTTRFYGNSGIQKAVIVLIKKAIEHGKCNIKFYCDNNTEWLFNAPLSYHATVIHLFQIMNTKNISYESIQNFGNDSVALRQGIQQWLAPYMTGLITGYIAPDNLGNFCNTLVVIPGVAAIYSTCITGCEDDCVYLYTEDPESISYTDYQFEKLKEKSKPLTNIISRHTLDDYLFVRTKIAVTATPATVLNYNLFICTMPPELFARIINRNSAMFSQTEKKHILDMQYYFYCEVEKTLEQSQHPVYELVSYPDPQDVKDGKVNIDLSEFLIDSKIPYSAEDYSEHIKNIIRLAKKYDTYHVIPLSKYPFQNFGILLKEPSMIAVRIGTERILSINHPEIYDAFSDFTRTMTGDCILPFKNKKEIIDYLSRYIITK